MANTKIVLNRQSDLILDNALITNPQGIVLTDISGVSEAVASINSATSADLSAEASSRVSGDESIASKLSYEVWKGAQELNGAFNNATSARVSADESIAADLSSEASARATAIDNEQSARIDGDQSLQNQIDFITNNTDAAAIDSLTEIVAAFQSADGDINNAITNLADAAGANLSTEVARAESAEASLDAAKLNLAGGNMSGSIYMDGNNVSGAGYVSSDRVSTNNLDGFGSDITIDNGLDFGGYNLPKNLSAPTVDGDATNKLYVDNAVTSVSAELSISVSDRVAADESLASTISTEIESLALTDEQTIELNTADNTIKLKDTVAAPASGIRTFLGEVDVDSVLKVAGVDVMATLSTETSDRIVGDLSLAADLSTEVSRAESAEQSIVDMLGADLSAEVSTEVSDRIAGDEYLQSQLDNLAQTDGLTLDVDLTNNTIKLKDTVNAPLSGIRTFEGLINVGSQPANDGAFGDLSLVTKKFVEDADASIMSIVNNVISNTDAAALDSLTEIVAAFQSADGDLNNTITNLVNAATTDLNAEIDARISAVTSLDDKIDAFPLADDLTIEVDEVDNTIKLKDTVAAPLSGIRTFMGEVDVDAVLKVAGVDVMAEISSEVARAESAEQSIVDMLGADLSAEVSTEVSDRIAGDLSLAADLSAEISRATAAENSIATVLSTEVSSIIANTDLTSIDSFAEVVENLSNEVSRAESVEASIAYDVETIYAKHVTVVDAPNDTLTVFNLAVPVKGGSELIYVNGLLQDSEDYTPIYGTGNLVTGVEFAIAPIVGDKVRAYGVYGFVF